MSYKCPHCTKRYLSKSGLRRHVNAQHPIEHAGPLDQAAPHEEPVADVQDADDLMAERDAAQPRPRPGAPITKDEATALTAALKALGIRREDVYQFKVYPTKVVIIEEPKRWKKTWYREEQ